MKNIRSLIRRIKFSRESVMIFASLKKRDKAYNAMAFHELKIMFRTLLITITIQSALIILYYILIK